MPQLSAENNNSRQQTDRCPTCDYPIPEGATLWDVCNMCGTRYNQSALTEMLREAKSEPEHDAPQDS